MAIHLAKEIIKLKKLILQQSAVVEESVKRAVLSFMNKDVKDAKKVVEGDYNIDRREVELEEECLKILALHQPVAIDLRYVISCLKMNNDLERIGDLASGIAKQAIGISEYKMDKMPVDFTIMMERTQEALKMSLDALMEMDANLAREVESKTSAITDMSKQTCDEIKDMIEKKPKKYDYFFHVLGVVKMLERISDYAANIAEDVVYMITGEIIRHQSPKDKPGNAD